MEKTSILSCLISLTLTGVAMASPNTGIATDAVKAPEIKQPRQYQSDIKIPTSEPTATADTGGIAFSVQSIKVSGSPLPEEELQPILTKYQNKNINTNQLHMVSKQITEYLHKKGYIVAQAYIPPQEIDQQLQMKVIVGTYNNINITGSDTIKESRIRQMLGTIKTGANIHKGKLEKQLQIINDLSGINVAANIQSTNQQGRYDLTINIEKTKTHQGMVYIDNYGNRHSGKNRIGLQHSINNLTRTGDKLTISGLMGGGSDLKNWQISYKNHLNSEGTEIEINHGQVDYEITKGALGLLKPYGTSKTTGVNLKHPLRKSNTGQTNLHLGYEHKKLSDTATDKIDKISNSYTMGISGDQYDKWLGGGYQSYKLMQTYGKLNANDVGSTMLGSAGNYSKTNLEYYRNQQIAKNLNLHIDISGQLSNKNLDSSEKIYISGANGVRAYGQGEAGGDEGYLTKTELRYKLPVSNQKNQYYLGMYYDNGAVKQSKYPITQENNKIIMQGMGMGLLWVHDSKLAMRMDYAWKVGKHQAEDKNNGRAWLQFIYSY